MFRTLVRKSSRKNRRPADSARRRRLFIPAAAALCVILVATVYSIQNTDSLKKIPVVFEPIPIALFDTAPRASKGSTAEQPPAPDPAPVPEEPAETAVAEVPADPTILAYKENAGKGYLNRCVFLGDSRTVSMVHYGLINDDAALAQIGISHSAFKRNTFTNNAGREYTLRSYLSSHQVPVIYIALGVNGINDPSEEHYRSTYIDLINTVRKEAPGSSIVLMSIGPVNDNGAYKKTVQNAWVRKYNEFLLETAREEHLYYLNISEILTGSDGQVKSKYDAGDGLHYSSSGCRAILDYLVSHPVSGIPDDGEYVVHYVKPNPKNTKVTMDEGSGIDEEKLKELMNMMEEEVPQEDTEEASTGEEEVEQEESPDQESEEEEESGEESSEEESTGEDSDQTEEGSSEEEGDQEQE